MRLGYARTELKHLDDRHRSVPVLFKVLRRDSTITIHDTRKNEPDRTVSILKRMMYKITKGAVSSIIAKRKIFFLDLSDQFLINLKGDKIIDYHFGDNTDNHRTITARK